MRRMRTSSWQAALVAALAFAFGAAHGADPFDIAARSPPRVVGADYFGTHFHRLGRAERGAPATRWPAGMIGALRLWDSGTRWADIEPADGRFDFARLDLHVALAEAQGVPVLLVLGSPARWASARPNEDGPYGPGSAAEPRELADWDRYVSAVARRYRGRIAQYELWNEPYFSDLPGDRGHPSAFFTGSVATMVELARRARAALDLADPQARLLTPGFVGAANRLDLFLARGGARLVQGVAYHFYAESDPEFIRLAADVRAVMTRHGVARLPLYNTESGFALRGAEGQPAVSGLAAIDRREAAARLARSMVLGAFLGFDRFYQYAWDNGRMGMLKDDGRTETDSLHAYTAVCRWLRGTTLLGCRMQPARVVRCEGERGDRRLFIAWRAEGRAAVQMALPAGGEEPRVEHALGATPAVTRDATGARVVSVDDVPLAWWSHIAARRTSASP
ncbi:MAG: hypothetical protein ACSLE9_13220 [Burkholderiaceae bacterium]